MRIMLLAVPVMCALACGSSGGGGEGCMPSPERPYNVTPSTRPNSDFVLDTTGTEVCFAPGDHLRPDTCAPVLFQICGPRSNGDVTYCDFPTRQAEYRFDPAIQAERLYCRS